MIRKALRMPTPENARLSARRIGYELADVVTDSPTFKDRQTMDPTPFGQEGRDIYWELELELSADGVWEAIVDQIGAVQAREAWEQGISDGLREYLRSSNGS